MIREGETLVELKEKIPSEGLGPTVSSFANTLGGWLLLGVEDKTRKIVGWQPKGRADVVDYLRDLLRREVDPLPPFGAKPLTIDRKQIAVVRVYESADTPHLVRGTGSVYIREPGAKGPIKEHGRLIELARRGETARARAEEHLRLPLIVETLPTPWRNSVGGFEAAPQGVPHVVVRAAPLTITPRFADSALADDTADWCEDATARLLPDPTEDRAGPEWQSHGRGMVVIRRATGRVTAVLVVDAGGALACRKTWKLSPSAVPLEEYCDERLEPQIRILAEGLERLEVYGRAVFECWIWGLDGRPVDGPGGARGTAPIAHHLAGDLAIPAGQGDVRELAERWMRDFGRAAGLKTWEPRRRR
jgi:hypothetical protein